MQLLRFQGVCKIHHESAKDPVIRKAMNYVQKKWPAPPAQGELLDPYNRRKALSVIDSCMMFKERFVIPPSLIQERIECKQ